MKALQAGILVVAGALGAFVLMKYTGSEPAPAPAVSEVKTEAVKPENPAVPDTAPAAATSPAPKSEAKPPARVASRQPLSPAKTPVPREEPRPPVESASSVPPSNPAPVVEPPASSPAPPPPPPPPPPLRKATLREGTMIHARLIETVSSDRNRTGDTFTASLDEELVVDGLVIAERGARLEGRVTETQAAGKVKGLSTIGVELTQLLTSDGQRIEIQTESFSKKGPESKRKDAAKIGGGAALGAIIGGIAGGGRGAAIGAAAGGAAGGGAVAMTRGEAAVISSETKLSFRLRDSVTITERRKKG